MSSITVAALYKFMSLPDYKDLRAPLLSNCKRLGIKGSLLLAEEGINGTIAGTKEAIEEIHHYLMQDERFHGLEYKESFAEKMPFYRMKVLLKKEIVTLGVPGISPLKKVGTYVNPQKWNELIQDPDVLVIDTRNDYECEIGMFKGSIDPKTTIFREFTEYVQKNLDPQKHKRVAMCCTGGIRCEKASSYMLEQGFEEVYHLKGGILSYLENVPKEQSLWEGACFVFDHRVAVTHDLELTDYQTCYGCRWPLSAEDRASVHYKKGVHCPKCYDTLSDAKMKAAAHRQMQVELAQKRGTHHIGERS